MIFDKMVRYWGFLILILLSMSFVHAGVNSVFISNESSTSSTSFIDKASNRFTPSEFGTWLSLGAMSISSSSIINPVSADMVYNGASIGQIDTVLQANRIVGEFKSFGFFNSRNLTGASNSTLRYKNSVGTDTAYAADASIVDIPIRTAAAESYTAAGPVSISTSPTISANKAFTVSVSADYLIRGYAEVKGDSTAFSDYLELLVDGAVISQAIREPETVSENYSMMLFNVSYLPAGAHNMSIRAYTESSTGSVKNMRLMAVPENEYIMFDSAVNDSEKTTSTTTWLMLASIGFTTNSTHEAVIEYMTLGNTQSNGEEFRINSTIDGATSRYVSMLPNEITAPVDRIPFYDVRHINDSAAHTAQLWLRAETNKAVYAYESRIIVTYVKRDIIPLVSISLISPANITYPSLSVPLTYTVSGPYSQCWYSLDGGANISLPGCANSSVTASQGGHSLDIFANNTEGFIDSDSISFSIDIPLTNITIYTPTNTTYDTANVTIDIPLEYVVIGEVDTCWYYLNYGPQINLSACQNSTLTLPQGSYHLDLIANNTAGEPTDSHLTGAHLDFAVNTLNPFIDIYSPANGTVYTDVDPTYQVPLYILYDYINTDSCWYSFNDGPHVHIPACIPFHVHLIPGTNNITVFANNSIDEMTNDSIELIYIETDKLITIEFPTDGITVYNSTLDVRYYVYGYMDENATIEFDQCYYQLDSQPLVILPDCENFTVTLPSFGQHTLLVEGLTDELELISDSVTFNYWPPQSDTMLITAVCPDSVAGQMTLWLIAIIAMFCLVFGAYFGAGIIVCLGSFMLFVLTLTIVGCSNIGALVIGLLGVVTFIAGIFMMTGNRE